MKSLGLTLILVLAGASWLTPTSVARAQGSTGQPMEAPAAIFHSNGSTLSLQQFRGRKVMLWMFSTWCSSCAVAFEALAERQPELAESGLQVLALKNYENGGYPGPSLQEFVEEFGRPLLEAPNWTFGEVPKEMAMRYNPRRYPDVYFLIDEQGMLQGINGAPGATMDTILRFIESPQ